MTGTSSTLIVHARTKGGEMAKDSGMLEVQILNALEVTQNNCDRWVKGPLMPPRAPERKER